ncbi:hypothetical protein LCGC14_2859680 [marine sediment metagenome]|uniref:Uncharacterized protein n=1 Tax=marine sediment metagenome TaxID=412755 RepID=A0A0F9AX14_9ZZZZ
MVSKGADYDKVDVDRLSSFKEVAAILNVLQSEGRQDHTPIGVAETLFALKLVRNANLKNSGKPPNNESRMDTVDDAHNYLDLITALEVEGLSEDIGGLQ